MNAFLPIENYVPHRGVMLLLDCLLDASADSAHAPAARVAKVSPRATAEVRFQYVFKDKVFMGCSWLQSC